jgi:BASS family bile acid:Na+ symporter
MLDSILYYLNPFALVFMMFSMGISLTLADFRHIVSHPRAAIVAFACIFLIIPFVGMGMAWLMANYSPFLAAGMVILVACPSGAFSNFFSYLARANVALSVSLTAATNLVAVVSVPLLLSIGFAIIGERVGMVEVPLWQTIGHVLVMVLLPIIVAMGIRASWPEVSQRLDPFLRRASALVFGTLVILLMVKFWPLIRENGAIGTPILLALASITVLIGWIAGQLVGLNRVDRFTVAAEVGVHNVALANVLALNVLQRAELSVAPSIYAAMCIPPLLLLAWWFRRGALESPTPKKISIAAR